MINDYSLSRLINSPSILWVYQGIMISRKKILPGNYTS